MNRENKIMAVSLILILFLLISSCNSSVKDTPIGNENFSTNTEQLASTQIILSTSMITPSPVLVNSTSTPTIEPTEQSVHFTAVALRELTATAWQVKQDIMATKVAQFPPVDCGNNENLSSLSPDEKWVFTVCGMKPNKISIIHNANGVTWILESKKFRPGAEGIWGRLTQKFWDTEGGYFYFSIDISGDAGGDECFTGYGVFGLFRLNLKTGEVTTLVSPSEYVEITFSQTGRRYATDMNGVTITDLKTGDVVKLDAENVMDLSWSPDGTKLAFSTTKCNNDGFLVSSSMYVWNATAKETYTLLTVDKISLHPDSWLNNNVLRINGEDFTSNKYHLTIYKYDVANMLLLSSGTATPQP
jgi:hypothetical protein